MADNPYYRPYNDPSIAKGFDELAKVFAPPTAQDVYAAARAQAERQKMQGVAEMYKLAQDPNAQLQGMDKWGVATGTFAPNQSTYAVDQGNATKRRGDDLQLQGTLGSANIAAGAARYGADRNYAAHVYNTDVTARTSTANNAADNKTKLDLGMIAPVSKDATRFVPPDIASMYKTPKTQVGVVSAQQGEKNYLPDGRMLEGAPKPLTEEQVKATILGRQPQAVLDAIVFGSTPVENVPGPDGKLVPKTRPQVLAGGTAAVDRTHAQQMFNYRTTDGRSGAATIGPDGAPADAATGEKLPQGTILQHPSGVQNKDGLGATTANVTEANRKAAGLDVFDRALNDYEKLLRSNKGVVGLPGTVMGAAQNAVSVAQEFGQAFGNLSPMAKLGEEQVRQYAAAVGANSRNPAIAQARVLEADLAYKWAQMQNPTGEVSRQAFERALETITGGALRNNDSALEAISGMRQAIGRERQGVSSLRAPSGTPAPQGGPPAGAPTAVNPTTGEKVYHNGQQWVPY